MQISSNYVQGGAAEWAKKASAEDSVAKAKKEASQSKSSSAQVSISTDAGKGNSAEALVIARANALPEIREEKIAVAKERIESGYYNTEKFSKELASSLVEG
jgi:anti-sigma28 factor (negative regulator of flagellin synthesis)